jgi:hypothetical protein
MARKQKRRPLSPSKNKSQWQALRESQVDEKRFREESIARLQKEYTKIQKRIDAMYLDKLDGRIDAAFFDAKRSEWREEQDQLLEATAGSGSLALTVNSRPKTVEKLSATSPAFSRCCVNGRELNSSRRSYRTHLLHPQIRLNRKSTNDKTKKTTQPQTRPASPPWPYRHKGPGGRRGKLCY